jgi:Fe-S cluster assembly protein SufD
MTAAEIKVPSFFALAAAQADGARRTGPLWLQRLRQQAAGRINQKGFPNTHDESWRFTPLLPLDHIPFEPASPDLPRAELPAFARADPGWLASGARIVLVNGAWTQPSNHLPQGVEVRALRDVLRDEPELVQGHLGQHAGIDNAFAALNTALFEDGLYLRIARGALVEQPLHVVHVAVGAAEPTAVYPRVVVVAEEGSQCKLVETYMDLAGRLTFTCAVTEVAVGAGAVLDHARVQEEDAEDFHIATLAVQQQRSSRYASRVVTLGAALSRLDLSVSLDGEGAECELDGLYVMSGRQHCDHQTVVDHCAPHTTSREKYKGILDGQSRAVFDGTIYVRPGAVKTNGRQENRNLILSREAICNTKPHLEIDADDVKCSHGATVGQLDEAALFYLRTRGISRDAARAILTYAFAREIVDRIPVEPVRRRLAEMVLARLPAGGRVQELS